MKLGKTEVGGVLILASFACALHTSHQQMEPTGPVLPNELYTVVESDQEFIQKSLCCSDYCGKLLCKDPLTKIIEILLKPTHLSIAESGIAIERRFISGHFQYLHLGQSSFTANDEK